MSTVSRTWCERLTSRSAIWSTLVRPHAPALAVRGSAQCLLGAARDAVPRLRAMVCTAARAFVSMGMGAPVLGCARACGRVSTCLCGGAPRTAVYCGAGSRARVWPMNGLRPADCVVFTAFFEAPLCTLTLA
jgi:hypothetical protein